MHSARTHAAYFTRSSFLDRAFPYPRCLWQTSSHTYLKFIFVFCHCCGCCCCCCFNVFCFAGIATNHGICVANFLSIRFIFAAEIFPLPPSAATVSLVLFCSSSLFQSYPYCSLTFSLHFVCISFTPSADLSIAMAAMSCARVYFMCVCLEL